MVFTTDKWKKVIIVEVHIFVSENELITAFAGYFIAKAREYVKSQGYFNVALAGGSSPKRVYELLASPDFREQGDWTNIYFFFGDERHVPAEDAQNNGLMVDNALLKPLHIADDHIFRINTSLTPKESAREYNQTIKTHFSQGQVCFDLILLGLGDNAHTASLFPFTEVLNEREAGVRAVYLEEDHTYRITMTAPLINQAKNIAYLAYGEKKAEAVEQVINGAYNPEMYPAQLINPKNGELHWFLDEKASKLLK